MTRTYGTLTLANSHEGPAWIVAAEPHVLMMLKRIFTSLSRQFHSLRIFHNPANAELLEWFLMRYPLEISWTAQAFLTATTNRAREQRAECEDIMKGARPFVVGTLLPLRHYQVQGVELLTLRHALLYGDDLGLGKTAIALGAIAAGLQPAIVVCQTHLQSQWVNEARKFLSGVKPHIVKTGKHYRLPEHNLLVITYSKLAKWGDYLKGYNLVVFDEAQELRINGSQKYAAASAVCNVTPNRIGLTATPVYNYGDEIFNIMDLLEPSCLGKRMEFLAEWCVPMGNHHKVIDPQALGSFLAENHLFLRRRRHEVGRELPAVTKVSEEVEYNSEDLLKNEDKALELAKAVLRGNWNERGKAALELNAMWRMQTGIAKAPFVAEFVINLAESGESVVLAGWHREVYTVWQRLFERRGVKSRLYTGSETNNEKEAAARDFIEGRAQVFILSLRSGAGLNGLQTKSNIIVFGELDWSPQVHEQCIGRLNRDGQKNPVTSVYLYAAGGSDPIIAQTLGIKRSQSEGIINPNANANAITDTQAEVSRATALAKAILAQQKMPVELQSVAP